MYKPMRCSLLFLFSALYFSSIANVELKDQTDSTKYNLYFKKAEAAKKDKKFELAISLYEKALSYANDLGHNLIVNQKIALSYINMNKLDSAEARVSRNLKVDEKLFLTKELKLELAKSYDVIRIIGSKQNDFKKIEKALLKSISILEKDSIYNYFLASEYLEMGINCRSKGDNLSAAKWPQKALDLMDRLKDPNPDIQIRAYGSLGLAAWHNLDLKRAMDYFKHISGLIDPKSKPLYHIQLCNNIGLIYHQKQMYDSALVYFRMEQNHLNALKGTEHEERIPSLEAQTLNNVGNALFELNRYNEAEKAMQDAIKIKLLNGSENNRDVARMYLNLGINYFKRPQPLLKNSELLLKKSLKIRKALLGLESSSVSMVFNSLGDLYKRQKEYTISKLYYDSAFESNPKIKINQEEIYEGVGEIWNSLLGKMETLVEEGSSKTSNEGEIENLYQKFKLQINYVFTRTSDDALQSGAQSIFSDFFDIYYSLYEQTKDKKYIDRLWEISVYKKGCKLMTRLNDQIALRTLLPKSLADEEKRLSDSVTFYTNKKWEKQNVDSLLFKFKTQYNKLIRTFETDYPAYYALKYAMPKTTVETAQTSLKSNSAILDIFDAEKNIYGIYLTNSAVVVWQKQSKSIDSLIRLMNQSIANNDLNKILSSSSALKQELIPSSVDLGKIRDLEIIPDGKSWQIQFSLLRNKLDLPSAETDFIGKTVNISYQYSYDHSKLFEKIKRINNQKVLAFSFSDQSITTPQSTYSKFRDLNGDLPGTSREIREISKTWDGDYYYSNLASESSFKKNCKDYQVLHLAMHGAINDQEPNYSKLQFVKSDTTNDGFLYAYEIYNLTLNAELAVLSACNSGSGKIQNGEGIISLGRAFAFAGVNSLLLSKWEVSDATSPIIMKYFYEGLKKGLTKSEALRLAKVKFLELDADNITSSPYYWDSFYILGDDKPLASRWSTRKILSFTAIFIVLIALLIWGVKQRKLNRT
jgi:CHAT domain-containing protein